MAEVFKVTRASSVNSLKSQFKKDWGCTLRIYNGKKLAEGTAKISDLTKKTEFNGTLTLGARSRVGNVEDYFKKEFGITVQVANADNTKLAGNDMTLTQAKNM